LGKFFLRFSRNILPSSSGLGFNSRTPNSEDEGSTLLQISGRNCPATRHNKPEEPVSQYEKRFTNIKAIELCVFSVGSAARVPQDYGVD
jgi:hypothetical protein